MCRSIKLLRNADSQPTDVEVQEAVLQFVRKISGYRKPSRVNENAFDLAVEKIATTSHDLLESLVSR